MLGAVVLSRLMQNYRNGQQLGLKNNLVCICLDQLANASAPYKQWLTLCLAQLWADYDKARWVGVRDTAHEKLYLLLGDETPEVSENSFKYQKNRVLIRMYIFFLFFINCQIIKLNNKKLNRYLIEIFAGSCSSSVCSWYLRKL